MNPLIQSKYFTTFLVSAAALVCFGLLPGAQAVVPAPDGGYPRFNTAEGQSALFSLTTGAANTAVGWYSLFSDTTGSFNTATGAGALLFNTADNNTAFGAAALLFNTNGLDNTAVGAAALLNNIGGSVDTPSGQVGSFNTAVGASALLSNTTGVANTAIGATALLDNLDGVGNTAIGDDTLSHCTGNLNVALGLNAGTGIATGITTGSNIIAIGFGVSGISSVAGEVDDACYIGNIWGQGVNPATSRFVFVDSDGKLGTESLSSGGAQPQAMLNEFFKEHQMLHKQGATIVELKNEIAALAKTVKEQAAQIQKVSAHLEMSKFATGRIRRGGPAPEMVLNNQ